MTLWEYVWDRVNAAGRENIRKLAEIMEGLDREERVQFLALVSWVNWVRGHGDRGQGIVAFWGWPLNDPAGPRTKETPTPSGRVVAPRSSAPRGRRRSRRVTAKKPVR